MGGLNAVAAPQQAPQQTPQQVPQAAPQQGRVPDQSAIAASMLNGNQGLDINAEFAKYSQSGNALEEQIRRLQDSLRNRQQGMLNPNWAAFTEAVSRPTKTGSAFEALGAGLGAFSKSESDVRKQELEDMQTEIELTRKNQELHKQRLLQNAASQLIQKRQDQAGNESYVFNPQAVDLITKITGDPKYAVDLMNQTRDQAVQQAYRGMFKDAGDGKYQLDPNAVRNVFALAGPKAAGEMFKAIPEMRRMGLLGDVGTEGTPFDALALASDNPMIKQQAQAYADRYRRGQINDEQADKLSKDLMQMLTSSMDRQAAREQTGAIAAMQHQLAVQAQEFRQQSEAARRSEVAIRMAEAREAREARLDLARERLEAQKAEQAGKLTDEQKIVYRSQVVPIVNEGTKAQQAIAKIDQLISITDQAPSGTASGAFASTIGRLTGTDARTAQLKMEQLTKELIPQLPRLPGAASNLDSTNMEKSLGELTDITKTNEQRRALLGQIKEGLVRQFNRAMEYEEYWNKHKKLRPLSPEDVPAAPAPGAAPAAAPEPASGRFRVVGTERPRN